MTYLSHTVDNPEQAALISSLRHKLQQQAVELESLQALSSRPPEFRESPQSVALIASLREQLQRQSGELEALQKHIAGITSAHEEEVRLSHDSASSTNVSDCLVENIINWSNYGSRI